MSQIHSYKNRGFSRRTFIRTGAIAAVPAFLLGSGTISCSRSGNNRHELRDRETRNIIFMVSDGMSMGTLTLADIMLRRRDGRSSNWIKLYEEDRVSRGLMDMASRNRIVTDSAAASSSWSCGYRVNNFSINIGSRGEAYKPILKYFRDAGKSTGLVTTTTITHATPAGFAANVSSRYDQDEIAVQYLERGYDVLLGGGSVHFDRNSREDKRDLFADFAARDYHIVSKKSELFNLPNDSRRILGTFYDSHLPHTLDLENTPEYRTHIPTLAEMTQIALNRLSKNNNGFIVQIEGGRVDHAAHHNDVGGLIFDQIAFDDAIGVVIEFAENNPETLVLITSDHGTGNPGFNASHQNYFDRIQKFRHTNKWILEALNGKSTISQIRERIEYALQIGITDREAEMLQISLSGNYEEALYRKMSVPHSVLGQILANYISVGWAGRDHTADYVELTAFGPGSELINPFMKNTDLFWLMVDTADVMTTGSRLKRSFQDGKQYIRERTSKIKQRIF